MYPRLKYLTLATLIPIFSLIYCLQLVGISLAKSSHLVLAQGTDGVNLSPQDRKTQADRLLQIGIQQFYSSQFREALQTFEQVRTIYIEINDKTGIASALNNIGEVYNELGQPDKAMEVLQQALSIRTQLSDKAGVGETLNNLGILYRDTSQYGKALEMLQQALAIRREVGDRIGEGRTLFNMGVVHRRLSRYPQALEFYQQALEIAKATGDRINEGRLLNGMGYVYNNLGQYTQALEFYQLALAIRKSIGDRSGEAATLGNIGIVYDYLGQYHKAIEFYQQALSLSKTIGKIVSAGNILSNIGGVYYSLGQYPQALDSYQQALAIIQKTGDKFVEAATLNNIGLTYNRLGKYSQALAFYQQALAIRKSIGDRAGESNTLGNMGVVYDTQGQYAKALELFEQALAIRKSIGDRAGEGGTLNSIGSIYKSLGQYPQALDTYQQALAIQKEVGDRPGERITLSNIAKLLETQNKPELAISFYKQSVNVTEAIRKDLEKLSREQQQSYTTTVADTYRSLADLLLKQNRVLEAQQALDLLKLQELDNYLHNVRGNEQTSQGVDLLPQEQKVQENYAAIQNKAIELGKELAQLQKIPEANRTPAQQQRIVELVQIQQQIRAEFNNFINNPAVVALTQQLSQSTGGESINLRSLNKLQAQLKQLQRKAVLLYPLILEDRLELVVVTSYSPPIKRTVNAKRQDINKLILELRTALTQPNSDAKTPAGKLYDLLIKPIEKDLRQAEAEAIIYAPDGQLRYLPIAALYDRKQWLVQRFAINNITAASLTEFNSKPPSPPRILAAAFTQGTYNVTVGNRQLTFAGLPFAGKEVENLAASIPSTTKLLDNAFNPQTTIPRLNDYNIIHLATHAAFVTGQPEDSFILFGDGSRVTLRDVESWSLPNVELVVLSACETGVGGQLGNGEEILGFGYQMQLTGARAAIASLWSVSDGGTQALMDAFYTAIQKGNITKAEALQQAQIALITGDFTALGEQRGIAVQARARSSLPPQVSDRLSHPFYWSPFILIGNGL
ncbi:CHAT domain-containing protein [Aerosakkonema funiforme]|uniref:Tetratricopeptide repeat protein n=2 Tax=Oscillatoriophycideae TaxID=1301283 RepID=A0A926VKB7_9CYAN|nr:tetratricopeptide repeat protein [Aerosakkonema funiforme]MBD2185400.1 tetratricopeptide repeat protein [Aerosakkonema funiforme FACHB-1375]